MTEILHSREYRQQQLKEIIMDLHRGKTPEEVKPRFQELIKDIGPTEIANLEQKLIGEGLPEQEIKRLCDVHVAVFRETLDQQIHDDQVPGHPLHTFRQENDAVEALLGQIVPLLEQAVSANVQERQTALHRWQELHGQLMEIEKHYSRKEHVLFPYLEKYGISGPPSVMWSIHDEIRDQLKKIRQFLNEPANKAQVQVQTVVNDMARPMIQAISDMIYKEEKIMFPMCLETLTEVEWDEIYRHSDDVGYTLITPDRQWQPKILHPSTQANHAAQPNSIPLEMGALNRDQINAMLKALPLDITFVDKDDRVLYYSQGKERIFTRTPAIIGRKVELCHPPESVHVVKKIVEDFKTGKRDQAEFWLTLQGKFLHIRYFPVRDDGGQYMGVLEVTQDVTGIRALQGQNRLLDDHQQ